VYRKSKRKYKKHFIDDLSEWEEFPVNQKPDEDFTIKKSIKASRIIDLLSKQGLSLSFKLAK
jgi:hypothetical protein